MDRLDYVSMMCNEHAYCLAIEKLMGIEVPVRAQYIRVMFSEITRLLNHLMWLGAHGLDCGAMNIFIYCFREREDLFDMYEAASRRAHARRVLPPGWCLPRPARHHAAVQGIEDPQRSSDGAAQRESARARCWTSSTTSSSASPTYVDEYETLLTENRIWKQRTVGIGVVTPERGAQPGLYRSDAARLGH